MIDGPHGYETYITILVHLTCKVQNDTENMVNGFSTDHWPLHLIM